MNSSSTFDQQQINRIRGYIEGYYGKLLSWSERGDLVASLASLQLNTYCYAPKEDPHHRLYWREPYDTEWLGCFRQWCEFARDLHVSISAGIAPGLDFKFDNTQTDFNHLHQKATALLNNGASHIVVLWDDIDDEFVTDEKGLSEGAAHAQVINQLADTLNRPLWTVPRVYADEIENKNNYLEDFFTELNSEQLVLLCGRAIVTSNIQPSDLQSLSRGQNHRTVVWDNFYANDYCPRQLFLGPWTGREEISDYLINPTGMPYTDQLLLDIASTTQTRIDKNHEWTQALQRHGVPDAFLTLAPYFLQPIFGDIQTTKISDPLDYTDPLKEIHNAIEHCLWKWKSPLAREWYPYLFGLKHDLSLTQGTLPRDRIIKTQTPGLTRILLDQPIR